MKILRLNAIANLSILVISLFISISISAQNGESEMKQLLETERHVFSQKSKGSETRNSTDYDLKYHRLEWNVDPDTNYISGSVYSLFEVLATDFDEISFSLYDNMSVDSVSYHNTIIPANDITHSNNTVTISLPITSPVNNLDSIKLYYHGNPVSTGFGSFITTTRCDKPAMWTLSEPFGAQRWWPCKQSLDDKIDSIDIIVTTPSNYKVASNGTLISNNIVGSDIIYHWKHNYPIAAYLIAIGVYEYAVYSDYVPLPNGGQIEVLNYVYPCSLATAQNGTPFTVDAILLFDSLFGLYPFADEKYGHAQFGWGGGMEHQTMSFMGGFSEELIAHELAHQWFGDKVTCGSWQDIWLNESWATYCEGMTHEAGIRSNSNFTNWLQSKINSATSSPNGSVYIPASGANDVSRIFNYRLSYAKGAIVLHMLRGIMGDDCFFPAVINYLNDVDISYGYALTPQFQTHLEAECGANLDEFFADWVYGEGWPTYDIIWSQDISNNLHITVNQSQSHPSVDFFNIPIPLFFTNGTNDTMIILDPVSSNQDFVIPIDFNATNMVLDPENSVLMKGTVTLPLNLVSFGAETINNEVQLSWTTENEINMNNYEIERSIDNKNFTTISSIKSYNNISKQKYIYTDTSLPSGIESVYYKLATIDNDGRKEYSKTIFIQLDYEKSEFKIYPNPTINNFELRINTPYISPLKINIFDSFGRKLRTIYHTSCIGQSSITIDIEDYAKGDYILELISLNIVKTMIVTKI